MSEKFPSERLVAPAPQAVASTHRPAASADSAANVFDPWILWVTFRRCWQWAVPAGAALAGIAAFVVLQGFVPRYRASYLLEANEDFVVFKGVMPVVKNLSRTEKGLFFNPIVLDPVLADASLRSAPSLSDPATAEAKLRRNLSIKSGGTESRLVVSYEDTSRAAAAMVCNAVVESYLRQRDSFDSTRVNNLERWLEPEILRWEQEVEERQDRVYSLSEKSLGYTPGHSLGRSENDSNLAMLTELRSEIGDLRIELALFDAKLETPVASASQVPSSDSVAPGRVEVPGNLLEKSEPLEANILRAIQVDIKVREANRVTERYRAIVLDLEAKDMVRLSRDYYNDMNRNLDAAEKRLARERKLARSRVKAELQRAIDEDYRQRKEVAKQKLAWQKSQIKKQQVLAAQENARLRTESENTLKLNRENARKALVSKLEIIQKQYNEEHQRLEKFGGTTAELQFANDELQVASEVLTKLRNRVAAIRTERRQDGAVRTLASATPPKAPVETVPYKKLAGASTIAFVVPFLLGLLWEYRIQRVTDASTFNKSNEVVPVMGEIARLPSGPRSTKGRRVFEESIDTLRANLFLSVDTRNTRSIAVVSSMSGEGKSSVASQLALSIAKATGETVLLVDGDLRCPDQHDIFGLEMGPGFTGVLSGEAQLADAIDTSLGDMIHVLPAGRLTASPHRLISPSSIKDFVDSVLESYSYVVLDTAPVLAAGETLAIASAVDSNLICVMRDVSRLDNVTRTTHRLEAAGASIAGTVFSGISARQYGYRYGDYHYGLNDAANGQSATLS